MDMKRIETRVELDVGGLAVVHKAVVYVVRDSGTDETLLLAPNHRWRDGILMVVFGRDIDDKAARKLFYRYSHAMCERCLRKWDGTVGFRVDLNNGRIVRAVCAYCDPTVYDLVLGYDYEEVARQARQECKHKHD
jgi:hypothetical protein